LKNYIIDTHALLWFLRGDTKLSETAHQIILDGTLQKSVSIVSLWEISIKNRIGKLPLKNGVSDIFDAIETMGFGLLRFNRKCIETYDTLPLLHRDPFDGMIVATAMAEQMTVITTDESIQKYNVDWVW